MENRAKPAIWQGGLEDIYGYERIKWYKGIVAISEFINNEDKTVLDLGAGNMHLRSLLPDGVLYYPVDYKRNAENTIVCDFNKGEFPDLTVDVIVAVGILEYINEPFGFLDKLAQHGQKIILTYKGREKYPESLLCTDEIISFLNSKGYSMTNENTSLPEWTIIACFEKMSPGKLSKQLSCTGCGACVNSCNYGAINLEYDDDGYLKPRFDKSKCIGCNECLRKCPSLKKHISHDKITAPKCYAFWGHNDIRIKSSSGGFFPILANYIIDNGGYVVGAIWGENFNCELICTNDKTEVEKMRFSKYVQSNAGFTYRRTKELLDKNIYVAFFGLPCQIAGLKSYLEKEYLNLVTIDLICFYSPSNLLFQKYLDENYGIQNVKNVCFRDKSLETRWDSTSYRIELNNGKSIYPLYKNDRYQQAFQNVLARNNTCENCQYYRFPRQGDFTIGDFWGIDHHDTSWNDNVGTSLVLSNNQKSQMILNAIKAECLRIEEVPLAWTQNKGNRVGNEARPSHKGKEYFNYLVKRYTFNDAVDMALGNKHEIGLVCMQNYNIGNNLTNYALYQYLSDLGFRVLLIGNPTSCSGHFKSEEDDRDQLFIKNPYPFYDVLKPVKNKFELYKVNTNCDSFIVGSDQLWRSCVIEETDYFTCLDWVQSTKYKAAYGVSFGTNHFEGEVNMQERMRFYLHRFQRISVRELSGQDILRDTFNCESDKVLDPVFLCDRKYYETMCQRGMVRIPKTSYVAAYFLDLTVEKVSIIKKLAEIYTKGEYIIIIQPKSKTSCWLENEPLLEPTVEEWLAMIKNCEYFVTDSFHAVCFSIIFEKQFQVILDNNNWRGETCFKSFLFDLGLESRIVDSVDINTVISRFQNRIKYNEVNNVLKQQVERSKCWLQHMTEDMQSYKGEYNCYDEIQELKKDVYEEICKNVTLEKEKEKVAKKKLACELFVIRHTIPVCKQNIKGGIQRNMNIVAWGCGDCFYRNIDYMRTFCNISRVCDSSPQRWNKEIVNGIMCISPDELTQIQDVFVVIMVDNVTVAFEIVEKLRSLGIYNFTHVTNLINYVNEKGEY